MRWQQIVDSCNEPGDPPLHGKAFRYSFDRGVFQSNAALERRRRRGSHLAAGARQWRLASATYSVLLDRVVGVLVLALLVIVCLPWTFALIRNVAGRTALLVVGFGCIGACVCISGAGYVALALAASAGG